MPHAPRAASFLTCHESVPAESTAIEPRLAQARPDHGLGHGDRQLLPRHTVVTR